MRNRIIEIERNSCIAIIEIERNSCIGENFSLHWQSHNITIAHYCCNIIKVLQQATLWVFCYTNYVLHKIIDIVIKFFFCSSIKYDFYKLYKYWKLDWFNKLFINSYFLSHFLFLLRNIEIFKYSKTRYVLSDLITFNFIIIVIRIDSINTDAMPSLIFENKISIATILNCCIYGCNCYGKLNFATE
jgi:hypothetical protein